MNDPVLFTLFGGLAIVLLLYGLMGLTPVRGALRGLIAGLVPLTAYFVFFMGNWPGLDVVAIHVAVYCSAALLLYLIGRTRREAKLHWAPKLLIGFFAGLVLINAGFLYISTQGLPDRLAAVFLPNMGDGRVYTGFSGVTEHGNEAAKAVSSELAEQHRESTLGWQVGIQGMQGMKLGENTLLMRVEDDRAQGVDQLSGEIRLYRPGKPEVLRSFRIDAQGGGFYQARVQIDARGAWVVELVLKKGEQHFSRTWERTLS
jgi:nitrogen fixation protein FixH